MSTPAAEPVSTPAPARPAAPARGRRLAAVPTLAEQVESWARTLPGARPAPVSWDGAVALARAAFHPVRAELSLELARGQGRTHLAPRWGSHGLCGAPLDPSGLHGVAVTCAVCASRLPPEAD